ncbi:MAG: hypothetical protein JEY99_16765 [Spirochaetales bacterium]|nr:hypothetical protein [Spirochaetales bacterium]
MRRQIISALLFIILISAILPAEERPILTVLDFSVSNISVGDMSAIVSFMSSAIFETGKYQVIDKGQRDVILEELQFSNSGCSDESCQLEIGKLLAAEYIVVGDISKVGSRYILNTRILETESSKTINTARGLYSDLDELLDNMDGLAGELCTLDEPSGAAVANITAPSVESEKDSESDTPGERTIQEKVIEETPITENGEVVKENQVDRSIPDLFEESEPEKRSLSRGRKIGAFTSLIVGSAAAITGGFFIWDALDYNTNTVIPARAAYDEDEPDYGGMDPIEYFNLKESDYYDAVN